MKTWGKVVVVLGALALGGTFGCEKKPEPGEIQRLAGDKHLSKNEFKEAVAAYDQSLKENPNQEKVWEKKAVAHWEANELDEADAAILKTLDFKPDAAKKAEVYRNLAAKYKQKQDDEKAEKYFNEALKVDPNDDVSLGWLGEMYAQRGGARDMKADAVPEHLTKAVEYYDKIIALKPDKQEAYVNKRIVVGKFMTYERKLKDAAQQEVQTLKDKDKVEAAKAQVAEHEAKEAEYKKQLEELGKKISELLKAAKGQ